MTIMTFIPMGLSLRTFLGVEGLEGGRQGTLWTLLVPQMSFLVVRYAVARGPDAVT